MGFMDRAEIKEFLTELPKLRLFKHISLFHMKEDDDFFGFKTSACATDVNGARTGFRRVYGSPTWESFKIITGFQKSVTTYKKKKSKNQKKIITSRWQAGGNNQDGVLIVFNLKIPTQKGNVTGDVTSYSKSRRWVKFITNIMRFENLCAILPPSRRPE